MFSCIGLLVLSVFAATSVYGRGYGLKKDLPTCPPGYPIPKICAEFCKSDADCNFGDFCCRVGCYTGCHPRPKEGICPPYRPLIDINECSNDYNCPGKEKCCDGLCQFPVKPGSCPKEGFPGEPCGIRCLNDFSCSGDRKCCGAPGCVRKCVKPCDK